MVSARQKLNTAFLTGGLVEAAADSVVVFVLALVALVAADLAAGNIRPGRRRRGK